MDTKILLENGTNELEVLEFTLGGNHYGINVAKVREILTYEKVTPVPNSHPSIEGIFMPRDTMITVVNLKKSIGIPENDETRGMVNRRLFDLMKPGATLINCARAGIAVFRTVRCGACGIPLFKDRPAE